MGKLFREDGSAVRRNDPDYHKYYQRWRNTQGRPETQIRNTTKPFKSSGKAQRTDYIPKPSKQILLELRDAMISKRMAKKWIKLIEDIL